MTIALMKNLRTTTRHASATLLAGALCIASQAEPLHASSHAKSTSSPAGALAHASSLAFAAETDFVVGLTISNTLVTFSAATPSTILSTVVLSGMTSGDDIVAIDYRPATEELFALGDVGQLYQVNIDTGALTLLTGTPFTLTGTTFGLDFNPTVDRIRLVSDEEQNLRLNPNTGGLAATDGTLAYALSDPNAAVSPTVTSAAYTNSFSGTRTTQLYVLDTELGTLVKQGSGAVSPNSGQLFTVGSLNVVTSTPQAGFDIATNGAAYASLVTSGTVTATLYSVNLSTGTATSLGDIASADTVRDIAIRPELAAGSPNDLLYGVTLSNTLIAFNAATPSTIQFSTTLSGMLPGENILGIDFRPATRQLVALGSQSTLYAVSIPTGTLTAINTSPFTPALNGSAFGIDFNPTVDRLRLVSNVGQDLRFNLTTPLTPTIDGTLAYTTTDVNAIITPNVLAAAYTNNFPNARATQLFVIDAATGALVKQGSGATSPNSGQLFTVGSLGLSSTPQYAGFDITSGGTPYAAITAISSTQSLLMGIDLNTGEAILIGPIGDASTPTVQDIAAAVSVATVGPAADGANGQYKGNDMLAGLTVSNTLAFFNASQPFSVTRVLTLTGMAVGENIISIDYRPALRTLVALGSNSQLYAVDVNSGTLTLLGGVFTPTLNSTNSAIDFNPAADRLRLVSANRQNLRFNLATPLTPTVDGTLTYTSTDPFAGVMPNIVSAAYTNNFSPTTSTQLFVVDAALGFLVKQGSGIISPNSGTLFPVGSLAVSFANDDIGFDIAPRASPYLSVRTPGTNQANLFVVDLATGKAYAIGTIGTPIAVRDVAVVMDYPYYLPQILRGADVVPAP